MIFRNSRDLGQQAASVPARDVRRLARRAISSVLVLACLLQTCLAVFAADDGDEDESSDRAALRAVLSRDRLVEREFARAQREFSAGRLTEGVRSVQNLLDRGGDSFLWEAGSPRPISARQRAIQLVSGSGSEALRLYRDLFEGAAREILREAELSRDPSREREVLSRFCLTRAAFQVIDRQATRAMAAGNPVAAAGLWSRALSEPAYGAEWDRPLLRKAMSAAVQSQHLALERRILEFGGERFPGERLFDSIPRSARRGNKPVAVEWPVTFGDARRQAVASLGPPALNPVWSVPFDRGSDPERMADFQSWLESNDDQARTDATALQAVVFGGTVAFRDFEGIRSVGLLDGRSIAVAEVSTSLRKLAVPTAAPPRLPVPRAVARAERPASAGVAEMGVAFGENTLVGTLSSDGDRFYAVDSLDLHSPRNVARDAGGAELNDSSGKSVRSTNFLVAYDLGEDAESRGNRPPVWRLGGPATAGGVGQLPFAGAFFLGPPLPLNDRLFAMYEIDRQICVASLDAVTGAVEWSQGLGYVERPIEADEFRSTQACQPVLCGDVLVCPTHAGFVVGVDADTGTLRWAALCGHVDARSGPFGAAPRTLHGDRSLPAVPLCQRGRVALLPHHDPQIHCFDGASGTSLWSADRRDGQFLGCLADDLLFVVGWRSLRGIDLETGHDRWMTPCPPPAGIGFRSGGLYYLPLQKGLIAVVDLRTGRFRTIRPPAGSFPERTEEPRESASPIRLGNLIPAGDLILSCGPDAVTAFRAADLLLEETLADLAADPSSRDLRLQTAELYLATGELQKGQSALRALLAEPLPLTARERTEGALRDSLFAELDEAGRPAGEILPEIERLSRKPADRARYLIRRAREQLSRNDVASVMAAARDFAALRVHEPVAVEGNPLHRIRSSGVIPAMVRSAVERRPPDERPLLEADADRERDRALGSDDIAVLEAFLSVYGEWPQSDVVRMKLASLLSDAGQDQRAELQLLQASRSLDKAVSSDARAALVSLWDGRGLHSAAALAMEELVEDAGEEPLAGFRTGKDWRASWPADSLTRRLGRQYEPLGHPVTRVAISEARFAAADWRLDESFKNYRRRFPTPSESSFHLLDKGTTTDSKILIVDKHTGVATGTLVVPTRNSYPSSPRVGFTGNFFPLGSEGQAHGVSLLPHEGESPFWTTALAEAPSRSEIVRAGPSGPSFAIFQSRQYLVALDPGTGRILWDRSDIDPNCGLISDPYAGLFGDEEAIVLFNPDRVSYTVYRTQTGEEIRQGRLEVDLGLQRRVFGRNLLFTADGGDKQLRLWDPLHDRTLMSVSVQDRIYTAVTPDDDLLVLTPPARLQLFSMKTGKNLHSFTMPDLDLLNLSFIRAFADRDLLYVNLQREMRSPAAQNFSYYVSDMFLPAAPVQGEFLAIELKTGRLLWKRTMPQRSVLNLSRHRLPFLVTLSRMRDRANGSRQSLLVEAIDKRTGATLGLRDNLFPDRLVLMNYDPVRERIELSGLQTLIRLDFGSELQRRSVDGGREGAASR